jgi:hypothetical protein
MKKYLSLLTVLLVGAVVYAVNMPGAPITDVKPSSIGNENAYKKTSGANFSGSSCPSSQDFHAKIDGYTNGEKIAGGQELAPHVISDMSNYILSSYAACINYFSNIQEADCSKAESLVGAALVRRLAIGIEPSTSESEILESVINKCKFD